MSNNESESTQSMFHGKNYIKEGKYSIEREIDDIHDRIINLRFDRRDGEPITIRSDYEIIYHRNGSYTFKTCTEKPDIKISYKQVSNNVAIEIDIEVTNFNFDTAIQSEKKRLADALNADPVQSCTIQMGYRGQFPNFTNPNLGLTEEHFFNLTDTRPNPDLNNLKQMRVQILAAWQKSYPPDSIMYFRGIVGTMSKGLRWNPSYLELVRGYGDPELRALGYSEIGEVLFQFVTRRFIRSDVVANVITDNVYTSREDFDNNFERNFVEREHHKQYIIGDTDIEKVDGIMTVRSALKYGIICTTTEALNKINESYIFIPGLTDEDNWDLARRGLLERRNMFNKQMDTLGGQLQAIQEHYPDLRWSVSSEGNIFFYSANESDIDIWNDKSIWFNRAYPLPAIYDMVPEGVRTIRCPFFVFLNPFMKVQFRGRYNIGSFVSFFYPVQTNTFLIISIKVEFATVQDNNLMEMTVVDQPPEETIGDKQDTTTREEATETTKESIRSWHERRLTVVKHTPNAMETDSRIHNIINNSGYFDASPRHWGANTPDERRKVEDLRSWNQSSWDRWLSNRSDFNETADGKSIENHGRGIGARTGIEVPWLREAGNQDGPDIIVVRVPYLPEYDDSEKVVINA